jgi:hypothetical protein
VDPAAARAAAAAEAVEANVAAEAEAGGAPPANAGDCCAAVVAAAGCDQAEIDQAEISTDGGDGGDSQRTFSFGDEPPSQPAQPSGSGSSYASTNGDPYEAPAENALPKTRIKVEGVFAAVI